jgi:hypothetical protein
MSVDEPGTKVVFFEGTFLPVKYIIQYLTFNSNIVLYII